MSKQFEKTKNAIVVHLKGEIDQCAASEIRELMDIEIVNSPKKNLIIDLKDVTLMDSSGIGLIVGRYKTALAFGGKTVICCADSTVSKMIELSGISKIIMHYPSIKDADNALC